MPTNQHTRRLRRELAKALARQDSHIATCMTCWGNLKLCAVAVALDAQVSLAAGALDAARGHTRVKE